jgi:hypothetical protein
MLCRCVVDDTCRAPLKLSAAIQSFSSSVHRRRRPVSTTSRRETSALSVRTPIRPVSYPTQISQQDGPRRRVTHKPAVSGLSLFKDSQLRRHSSRDSG